MKAISLWQPWASAIATGAKRIETRSWRAPLSLYGQTIAIHAAKKPPHLILRDFDQSLACGLLDAAGVVLSSDLPLGCIVATMRLDRCPHIEEISIESRHASRSVLSSDGGLSFAAPREEALGDYSAGRYGWILEELRRLPEPIPCVGRQGFFDLPDRIVAALELA